MKVSKRKTSDATFERNRGLIFSPGMPHVDLIKIGGIDEGHTCTKGKPAV